MIQVYPQIVQVGQYEIYNITTPYSFIVNGPGSIQVPYTVEYYVSIVLPNGTMAGWYANGPFIKLPRTVYVSGVEYKLGEPDQVVVNGPTVSARPMYVQVSTTSTTTATFTKTGHQAPHRTASSVSLLLTVVLIGLVLVTHIWSV
jgi:hypothetical protein